MRDSQRQKVYDAETEWGVDSKGRKFETVDECQTVVNAIWNDKRVQRAFPDVMRYYPPTVLDGRGRRSACANRSYIRMPCFTRNDGYILHEIAHSMDRTRPNFHKRAGHGPDWCRIYLKLVEIFLGFDEKLALFREMRKKRVKIN